MHTKETVPRLALCPRVSKRIFFVITEKGDISKVLRVNIQDKTISNVYSSL